MVISELHSWCPRQRRSCYNLQCVEGGASDAWRESGWAEEHQGSAQEDFPDVSLLTQAERDMVLGILPTTDQIRYMKDGGINQSVLWGMSVLIFFLASSKEPVLGVAGGTFPLYESILRAAYRNIRVRTSSAAFVGIWHAEVVSMGIEEGYPGGGQVASSLRILIGEPGPAGFTSDIQVPWSPGCQEVQVSDQVEVLVMSREPYFEDFQVVRDVYLPTLGLWLSDYPFLKRDAFERISEEMYWSRQDMSNS
eukprot:jgi/Ulvmu1/12045/UM083_0058.1